MNPELLKKCLSGKATDSEMDKYRLWLDGGDNENLPEETSSPADDLVGQRMLTHISLKKKQISKKQRLVTYTASAAACLLAIFYFSLFSAHRPFVQHSQVFKYDEEKGLIENNFNGITVKLAKNSEVSLQQEESKVINLRFLGSILLHNDTEEDQHIVVNSSAPGQDHRNLRLMKGHSYLLSYINLREEELIMVDQQRLKDIPPAVAMAMRQTFKL